MPLYNFLYNKKDPKDKELPEDVIKNKKNNNKVLKHSPSINGYYELSKTVSPYNSKRAIMKNTAEPLTPQEVNFISNYRGALGEINDYPTYVPFEGDKHWNIDRFIIDPAFSNHYESLKSGQSEKGLKMNVLADMYKYNMLQGQDRKEAFKNAKNFIKTEINPRINNSFFKNVMLDKPVPFGISIDTFGDGSNPIIGVRDINKKLEEDPEAFPYYRDYAKNPWSENKTKKIILDYLTAFKRMSNKDARNKYNEWKSEADAEDDKLYNN